MNVYVVLGETGEYSMHTVFVCGVYTTLDQAKAAMIAASQRRNLNTQWYGQYHAILSQRFSNSPHPYTDEDRAWALSQMEEPQPPYEAAERTMIFEVPLDQWNTHGFDEYREL